MLQGVTQACARHRRVFIIVQRNTIQMYIFRQRLAAVF